MNVSDYVLAVMSAGSNASYTPVKIQKMFFILDREIPDLVGGQKFNFQPYDYGPFDSAVYNSLDLLIDSGLVARVGGSTSRNRRYELTAEGLESGRRIFEESFDDSTQKYINSVVQFVKNCSFTQLVTAIYKQYPDMKVNSVFSNK